MLRPCDFCEIFEVTVDLIGWTEVTLFLVLMLSRLYFNSTHRIHILKCIIFRHQLLFRDSQCILQVSITSLWIRLFLVFVENYSY